MEPILQRLKQEERDLLMRYSEPVTFRKHANIFEEKNPANYLYFIAKGIIQVFKTVGPNRHLTVFTRGENDGIGEIGVFGGGSYSHTAQAMEGSELYALERGTAEKLLSENGGLSLHFLRWLAESLDASKAKLRDYIAFGSEGAVASFFVRYANMYGVVTPDGIRMTEPLVIQDISKHIAISRETVSRIVNKWKKQGVIGNDGKYFLLKDMTYFKRLLACDQCGVENCVL
ncbi:Crp/Fnr family transcriptional regulator [Lentibacillus cibarius]|uniref:Crp/Fnr family transcriptional regulator n=1 Tax=Lentibacillus cibarius TaxID=2583219 RepID=A0A5S3QMM4_9BACI|nr:Crp/Fnr family transcriptional regulator [Lentibacillus cibarius]TMN22987.1 Crp/Fnr family transcriptional regulator [Lentibacillus cibarius]